MMKKIKTLSVKAGNKVYQQYKKVLMLFSLSRLKRKTIHLFGCPIHPNMGDQAQTFCIQKWLGDNYPDYKRIHYDWSTSTPFLLARLRRNIGKEDLLFFHSGYFMVDHHKELPVYCAVIKLFPDYRIVIFPQTINFFSREVEAEVANVFNGHPDLHLMCRDEVSYAKAAKVFPDCKLLLYPDVVTSLIGSRFFNSARDGVLFCMRNDIEAHYKPEQIQALMSRFSGRIPVTLSDTSIPVSRYQLENHRAEILDSIYEDFSKYRLIITDRYHGTIFSLIAGTPVIVLSSADHKLSSGVSWFPAEFKSHVVFAGDLDEAFSLAQSMLADSRRLPALPPYFKEKYYDVLREKL